MSTAGAAAGHNATGARQGAEGGLVRRHLDPLVLLLKPTGRGAARIEISD